MLKTLPGPEGPAAPASVSDTPDPLRRVQAWADSAAEGLVGIEDVGHLRDLIAEARDEVRRDFVPLALAVEMARPKDNPYADHGGS